MTLLGHVKRREIYQITSNRMMNDDLKITVMYRVQMPNDS